MEIIEESEKKCLKCSHILDIDNQNKKFGINLCNICYKLSPDEEEKFKDYIQEKIDGTSSILEGFRKFQKPIGETQKKGMISKAERGELMSRPPFGYKLDLNGKLIPAENFNEVEDIFQEFLNSNISLTQLAKKHQFSVNGLKKILKNFTYIGKIKFNNQIHQGNHPPLISSTLFNHVQNKLERLGIAN